jgi:hypothetical protein
MENIEYVSLEDLINPILARERTGSEAEKFDQQATEARAIWKFKSYYSICAPVEDEKIRFTKDNRHSAVIYLAYGGNGLWAMSWGIMLPNSGQLSGLSVFNTKGYKTKEDAILAGIYEIEDCIEKALKTRLESKIEIKVARQILELLNERKRPQLGLLL